MEYFGNRNGDNCWIPLQLLDSTENLTESGAIEFVGPANMLKSRKFSQELYWIKAEVMNENRFQPFDKTLVEYVKKYSENRFETNAHIKKLNDFLLERGLKSFDARKSLSYKFESNEESQQESSVLFPSISTLTYFHPKLSIPHEMKNIPAAPKVQSIHTNTTWAIQTSSLLDEVLGLSTGSPNEQFFFSQSPVLSETIWVRERYVNDEQTLSENDSSIVKINKKEQWVKWMNVSNLLDSHESSRHYMVDRIRGKIQFGDGVNGKIPPTKSEIKDTYQTGGGLIGNVKAGEVKNLLSSIAMIERVENIDSAQGGADGEDELCSLEKGPKMLQH